jgi:hypothetical protein
VPHSVVARLRFSDLHCTQAPNTLQDIRMCSRRWSLMAKDGPATPARGRTSTPGQTTRTDIGRVARRGGPVPPDGLPGRAPTVLRGLP